jgi:cytochrome c oxidase subunit 2
MFRRFETKVWAALFLAVPVLCTWSFIASMQPGPNGERAWWWPENVSSFGPDIDALFMMILWITGIAFIVTETILVFAILRFGRAEDVIGGDPTKAVYSHGNHKLEIGWTIAPALILLVIALTQMGPWRRVKFASTFPTKTVHARVEASQFEWRMTYPGPDGKLGTLDDVHDVNHLHTWVGNPTLIELKSKDVIHSFFLPNCRLKQDAVPGMTIPVWFDVTKAGGYELMCAELCGWGHFKMKGWLTVHETQADFDKWLARQSGREYADKDADGWKPTWDLEKDQK